MTGTEDWACLDALLRSSAIVLSPLFYLQGESRERIGELSRQIGADYQRYKDGGCGSFKARVDQEVHARFQMALLSVSYCARKNGQDLPEAPIPFSDAELGVLDLLKKFALLDTFSPLELRQKLVSRDPSTEAFFTGYAGLKEALGQLVGHEEIRPAIRQYLKKQGELYEEKFSAAFGSGTGQFIVTALSARQREFDFISRIEHNLKSGKNDITFEGQSFVVETLKRSDMSPVGGEKPGVVNGRKPALSDTLPKNPHLMAVLTEKNLLWKKRSMVFWAVSVSHTGQYHKHGFDSKPLALSEIPSYLDPSILESVKNYPHILFCIASPTGFEDMKNAASGRNLLNSFISSNVSVCFWDLHNHKKIFNTGDKRSIELARICDLETRDEKQFRLQKILYPEIEHKLLVSQSVSLEHCREFSTRHDFMDRDVVEALFHQYAKERQLVVRNIPPMGPVIVPVE
ncbi:MAG: hypothetical protein WC586_06010 [Methanoregula sp.]